MLDLEITPGPWKLTDNPTDYVYSKKTHNIILMHSAERVDDTRAILLVPELLDVYKVASNLITSNKGKHRPLEKVIKAFEKRHGEL